MDLVPVPQVKRQLPPQLVAPIRPVDDLPQILAAGGIARFDARFQPNNGLFQWSLDDWERRIGHHTVRHHGLPEKYRAQVDAYLASCKDGVLIDVPSVYPYEEFAAAPIKVSKLFEEMRRFEGVSLEPTWDRDMRSVEAARLSIRKLTTYGVANLRRLNGFSFHYPDVFRKWKTMVHNVWFGTSVGGLHHDAFDNTLIQLSGRKRVIIYPPNLTDAIAATDVEEHGTGYPRFPATTFLSPSAMGRNKYLKYFPYYQVDLEPGDGVIIPGRAYHAATATSYDSISINSFLLPDILKGPFAHVRSVRKTATLASAFLILNRLSIRLTGRCFRQGPYEFI